MQTFAPLVTSTHREDRTAGDSCDCDSFTGAVTGVVRTQTYEGAWRGHWSFLAAHCLCRSSELAGLFWRSPCFVQCWWREVTPVTPVLAQRQQEWTCDLAPARQVRPSFSESRGGQCRSCPLHGTRTMSLLWWSPSPPLLSSIWWPSISPAYSLGPCPFSGAPY